MPEQTEAQRQAAFAAAGQQPVAQAPVTPVPTQPTPAAPMAPAASATPTTTVNVTTAPPTQPEVTKQSAQAPKPALTMPATGSVVDLLKSAGQASDFASRQQLAQQYGIQGYKGTAAQNTELAKKYLEAYNANRAAPTPESGAQAASALDSYFQAEKKDSLKTDPQATFFDEYAGMNPVVKTLYDNLNTALSSSNTRTTFTEEFNKLRQEQGIEGLQTDLMNINRIMEGTEEDIRDEIASTGGFATESQVQALAGARNKTLLKKAQNLQAQLDFRNDYIRQVMELTGADRAQVEKDVDRKLGIAEKMYTLSEQMQNATKENYKSIIDKVGYEGFVNSIGGDKEQLKKIATSLGVTPRQLESLAMIPTVAKGTPPTSVQEYEYAVAQGYAGSYVDYQNEDANRKRSIAAAGVSNDNGMTPKEVTVFNSIVDKYNKSPLVAANDRAVILRDVTDAVSKDPTNASLQVSFIYSFIQALDTYQSSVKEGEIGLISGTQGLGEKLSNLPDKINKGTPLSKSKIEEYITTAKLLTDSINKAASQKTKYFSKQASLAGDKIGTSFQEFVGVTSLGTIESLAREKGFDLEGAREKGYSDEEIEAYLKK